MIGLALVGCMSADMNVAPLAGAADTGVQSRSIGLRVNVVPSQVLRDSADPEAGFRALPQTFARDGVDDSAPLDLGTLALTGPVLQTGTVDAFRVNPTVADVPGETVPAAGSVRVYQPDSLQSYVASVGGLGDFSAWMVPGADYVAQFVPDDPLLPTSILPFSPESPSQPESWDLGPGVPIYGFVTVGGDPMVGARLHVVSADGISSTTAWTDETGYYQLRVQPGTWTVVCEGRDNGRDPTMTRRDLDVSDVGAALDVPFPPIEVGGLQGSVDDAEGGPAEGATVRVTSEALTGFDLLDGWEASWSSDIPVTEDGFFYSVILPGQYTIEVLPPSTDRGAQLSPTRKEHQTMDAGYNPQPSIALLPLVTLEGTVVGQNGNPLESAHVLCSEQGFDHRGYEAYSGPAGRFSVAVPNVPLTCEVTPPSADQRHPSGRFPVDPSAGGAVELQLPDGQLVSGVVTLDGVEESFAVVEVRDAAGQVLGAGLTGKDGSFAIRVDLRAAAGSTAITP